MASESRVVQHWRWWFEWEPGAFDPSTPMAAEHGQLVGILHCPGGKEEELAHMATAFQGAGDLEACAVAIGGGIAAICDAGRQFAPLPAWIERADALLDGPSTLSDLARASLLLHTVIAELQGPTHVPKVRQRLARLGLAVEQADSDPLRILHAAATAYTEALGGRLHVAEEQTADAAYLCPAPEAALFPKMQLQAGRSLVLTLRGEADQAGALLDGILAHPLFEAAPPSIRLLCLSHRLFALAVSGRIGELDALTARIRACVIPDHNAFLHGYLHHSLGVAALVAGRPREALEHGQRAMERGAACTCVTGRAVPALVVGQALADLGCHSEALAHFAVWTPQWQNHGFDLLLAAGLLEKAALLRNTGNLREARQMLTRATQALPPGDSLPAYHRPRRFGEELAAELLPASQQPALAGARPTPVALATLGGLAVRIGDQIIYDRDWRGDRTKMLLKALIVLGGHKVSSAQLCDFLWPDSDGVQARQNLKVATWRLRRLGDAFPSVPWLAVQQGQYSLVHALCAVDCFEFTQRLQQAQACGEELTLLTTALDLYSGDFLPRDDSQPWIVTHREQLRHRYLAAVHSLARRALTADRMELAQPYLDKAAEIDPANEHTAELQIRILLAQGYPGEALRLYHTLAATLIDTLGVGPGRALTDLIAPLLGRRA